MSLLPNSWVEVEWNEITSVDGFRRGPFGGNLKKSCFIEEGYAVYEQYAPINNDCENFRYFISEEKFQELSGFHVNNGDFLISCSGTMGRITHVPDGAPEGVINQALLRIRLQDKLIDPDYFLKLFKSPAIQHKVLNQSVGGAIQNLAAVKELKQISLPIAPLAEQKRIVEKLDEVLAQVDTIKARLDGIPAILKRFRQSVLASAVSGKLTEEWRANNFHKVDKETVHLTVNKMREAKGFKIPRNIQRIGDLPFTIPDNWVWERAGNVCLKITDGAHNTPKLLGEGYPYLMAKDLTGGQLDFTENRFISETEHRELYNKCQPEVGDLLVVNIGAGTGNNVLINVTHEFSFKNIAILKRSNLLIPLYLKYFFDSQKRKIFDEQTRGGAQPFLSLTVLNNILIALPPIKEQKEIVHLVDKYFELADTIEAQVKKAQARVDNLTQSILAKAFRGELVPQDPNDEPADKLLERIAQARLDAEALAKAAKKVTGSKKTAAK